MSSTCAYCGVPLPRSGITGQAVKGNASQYYCCSGCESMGAGGVAAFLSTRVAIGILVASQSMVLSLAINLTPPEAESLRVLQMLVLVANLGVAALLGAPLATAGVRSLLRGQIRMEVLFISGIAGALGISLQSMSRGSGPIYAEVVAILLVVYTLGKSVAARSWAIAVSSTRVWVDVPRTCRRIDETGKASDVDVSTVRPGHVIAVGPGGILPVDGVIVAGAAYVRQAMITGEAAPVVRRPGDHVWAGTACEDAELWIRSETAGDDRRVDRLIDAVDHARHQPGSLQRQADRLAAQFVPVVSFTALATFASWTWLHGLDAGIFRALSVLLVACPCALGLATPVIVWTALGRLAKRGLIARHGDLLERLSQVDSVLIDKTGTLTEDRLHVVDFITTDDLPITRDQLRGWLAALGRDDPHPVLRSFSGTAVIPPTLEILRRRVEAGSGIEALLREGKGESHLIRVGRREWVVVSDEQVPVLSMDNYRHVFVSIDETLVADATLAETPKPSAAAGLAKLEALGLKVEILTGDTAEHAAQLGWPHAIANLSPEDKCRIVAQRKAAGARPLFVGDGLNDAPALAASFVSIAPATGSGLANVAASATLFGDDLETLAWSVEFSREVIAIVRRTILTAAGYNVVGMLVAALGFLHPVLAALLMMGSSLWVVSRVSKLQGNESLRLTKASTPLIPKPSVIPSMKNPSKPDTFPQTASIQGSNPSEVSLVIHASAIALQGPLLAALSGAGSQRTLDLTVVFAVIASVSVWSWARWKSIPHAIDMTFGMVTLGHFGMLMGWWVGSGFEPVSCCECLSGSIAPGMWAGMIACGHFAMIYLTRDGNANRPNWFELATGHAGMVVGMAAGGVFSERMSLTFFASDGAMLIGMIVGMLIGHPAGARCSACVVRV